MTSDKGALSGNTAMLVLKLLAEEDMYGYQIIEELSKRSEEAFRLKTGTLYPILHGLEKDGVVLSYDENADHQRVRRYYRLTNRGKGLLAKKQTEWNAYISAVSRVMEGGVRYVYA